MQPKKESVENVKINTKQEKNIKSTLLSYKQMIKITLPTFLLKRKLNVECRNRRLLPSHAVSPPALIFASQTSQDFPERSKENSANIKIARLSRSSSRHAFLDVCCFTSNSSYS